MKLPPALAVSGESCPDGIPAKSKPISAPSLSACSCFSFSTHGSPDHRADSHSVPWGARRLRLALPECAPDCPDVQCHFGGVCFLVVAKLRRPCCRSSDGRTSRLDSRDRRRIPRRYRRLEFAALNFDLAHFSVRVSRATDESRLVRAHAAHAIGALRHIRRPKFRSL